MDESKQAKCAAQALWYAEKACGPDFPRITAEEAMSAQNIIIVDVRTAAEQAVGMIPEALTKETFERRLEETPAAVPGGTIVAPYCTVGFRSGQYAKALVARGIKDVRNHEGVLMHTFHGELVLPGEAGKGSSGIRRVHTYAHPWSGLCNPSFEEVQFGLWDLACSAVGRGPAAEPK